jgi:hypothetical protein
MHRMNIAEGRLRLPQNYHLTSRLEYVPLTWRGIRARIC